MMCDISGFFLYISSLTLLTFSTLYIKKLKTKTLAAFIIVAILASFRGIAGVDTPLYIIRFENLDFIFSNLQMEPIIPSIMWIAKSIGGSFSAFSLIYGLIVSLLYFYIFKNFPNSKYFAISIFPVIFVDSLFNGVRIGLAYPILFIAITTGSFLLIVIASLAHISALLAVFFNYFSFSKILAFICLSFALLNYYGNYFFEYLPFRYISKFNIYAELSPSTSYAGLADSMGLCFALIIYFRITGSRGTEWLNISILTITLIFILYYFGIREYTAALRIVRLLMFSVFAVIAKTESRFDRRAFLLSFIFGLAYSINFLRQIADSCSYSQGGFLPLNLIFY